MFFLKPTEETVLLQGCELYTNLFIGTLFLKNYFTRRFGGFKNRILVKHKNLF